MIVAGEASGDLHGSYLVRAAREQSPSLEFFGTGGERLRAAGTDLLFDLEHMSLMGISEVVSGIGQVWRTFKALKAAMVKRQARALVLIDYPELNLPLAKAAFRVGIPVFYYICPQIWAWRTGRVKKLGRYATKRVVVFPFEVDFYRRHGLHADFLGHPLMDEMNPPQSKPEAKIQLGLDPNREMLLLMPGSRKHLVRELLPVMIQAVDRLRIKRPGVNVVLARADTLSDDFLALLLANARTTIRVVGGLSHRLQNAADIALVASGTASFETALNLTPLVVIYRMKPLSFLLGKRLIKSEHISIANLMAKRRLIPELIQHDANPERIEQELLRILEDDNYRNDMLNGLLDVRNQLGGPGASRRAAEMLIETMGFDGPLG
jgi:lipid-A-disaccharide synthase